MWPGLQDTMSAADAATLNWDKKGEYDYLKGIVQPVPTQWNLKGKGIIFFSYLFNGKKLTPLSQGVLLYRQ